MKKLIVAAFLTMGMSTLVQAQLQGDASAGENKIAVCVACHGTTGNTVGIPGSAKLGGQNERYLLKQLQDIKNGDRVVPLMTGMLNSLSDQDMADIAAHYAGQDLARGVAEESALALGEKLYRAGDASIGVPACSACHSPTGMGNASAAYPALSGQDPAYTESQLRAFRSGSRQNDVAAVMRSIVARLNDAEISALSSYVSGLRE